MKSRKSIYGLGGVGPLRVCLVVLFILLALSAHQYPYFEWELEFSRAVQSIQHPLFSWPMNLVSELGNGLNLAFLVGISGFLLFRSGFRREAIEVGIYSLMAYIFGSLIKLVVNRPRPEPWLVELYKVVPDKSFPSLHVLLFTVFFGYLIYFSHTKLQNKALRYLIIVVSSFLILTIGLSRIYLGAHWAGDTLGGYLAGALLISFFATNAKR